MLDQLKPRSPTNIEVFDIGTVNLETAGKEDKIRVANLLFKMVSRIVREGRISASKNTDTRPPILEKDIGHRIKAQFKETYANTCRIDRQIYDGDIFIHHHSETKRGPGSYEFEENLVWIVLYGQEIFRALWHWNKVDNKSLVISTSSEAREVYAEIQKRWQEIA
jgi:hypothetical protein